MPIPLILGGAAILLGSGGIALGANGTTKFVRAKKTMKGAKERHEQNLKDFETQNIATCEIMDNLGKTELEILNSFEEFAHVYEKIKYRPTIRAYDKDGVQIPEYDGEMLKKVSVGAGVLLGALGGAALGTAGGFAAAGATTSAVMALGTASTGTAIASLSGVAATNATLAALGGGAIAAGGGGIALGTTILGAATAGVGLLVGGIIFSVVGKSISSKADVAWEQMLEAELQIWKISKYMKQLRRTAAAYLESLKAVQAIFNREFESMKIRVNVLGMTDYREYNEEQILNVENTVELALLLYRMCKVQLVLDSTDCEDINQINADEINDTIDDAKRFLENGMRAA